MQLIIIVNGGNLGGTVGDRLPTFTMGYSYLYPPTIPEVSGDVVSLVHSLEMRKSFEGIYLFWRYPMNPNYLQIRH